MSQDKKLRIEGTLMQITSFIEFVECPKGESGQDVCTETDDEESLWFNCWECLGKFYGVEFVERGLANG